MVAMLLKKSALAVTVLGLIACNGPTEPEMVTLTLQVAPERVECTGAHPRMCLQVREDPSEEWTYFYDEIEDFDYVPGYIYTLSVRRSTVENPLQDGSRFHYRLLEVIEAAPAEAPEAARPRAADHS